MRVWRLTRRAFADLSGDGARRYGGRWTSPGRPAIYTATSQALALLEVIVHLDLDSTLLPADYVMLEVDIPDDASVWRVPRVALRRDPGHLRHIGDTWLASGLTVALVVPSVIVPRETNWLLNPGHPEAAAIRIVAMEDFAIDRRLL